MTDFDKIQKIESVISFVCDSDICNNTINAVVMNKARIIFVDQRNYIKFRCPICDQEYMTEIIH